MTSSLLAQADLFADGDRGPSPRQLRARAAPEPPSRVTRICYAEDAARLLEDHGDYRVLRRLKPRPIDSAYQCRPGESVALVVDVETTGLDHRRDEVIEIGMVSFVHDANGRIGPVLGAISMLHEPTVEISAEITRLTGITAAMVAGHAIDIAAVRALLEPADLVIAHNAKFDRAFCERLDDNFRHKAWACSVAEVPWAEIGFEGAKLGYLVNGCGWFHRGHRAVDDCHALIEVLAFEAEGARPSCICSARRRAQRCASGPSGRPTT